MPTVFIVIVIVAVVAHCPAVGVNVYSVVVILLISGAHVPLMPLSDSRGSGGMGAPAGYSGTIPEKVGVTIESTVAVTGVRISEIQPVVALYAST